MTKKYHILCSCRSAALQNQQRVPKRTRNQHREKKTPSEGVKTAVQTYLHLPAHQRLPGCWKTSWSCHQFHVHRVCLSCVFSLTTECYQIILSTVWRQFGSMDLFLGAVATDGTHLNELWRRYCMRQGANRDESTHSEKRSWEALATFRLVPSKKMPLLPANSDRKVIQRFKNSGNL